MCMTMPRDDDWLTHAHGAREKLRTINKIPRTCTRQPDRARRTRAPSATPPTAHNAVEPALCSPFAALAAHLPREQLGGDEDATADGHAHRGHRTRRNAAGSIRSGWIFQIFIVSVLSSLGYAYHLYMLLVDGY